MISSDADLSTAVPEYSAGISRTVPVTGPFSILTSLDTLDRIRLQYLNSANWQLALTENAAIDSWHQFTLGTV